MMRRLASGLFWLLAVGLFVGAGRVSFVLASSPPGERALAEQARFLEGALARGAAHDTQALFPEGEMFLIVLSGLVTATDTTRPVGTRRAVVERRLAELDSPAITGRFGDPTGIEHGIFYQGWRLLLEVEHARLGAPDTAGEEIRLRARTILDAVAADPTGFVASYPNARWPVDTVVALAAVARADAEVGIPDARANLDTWLVRMEPVLAAHGGLFPHAVTASGEARQGPRGTSASLIALFMADIDPTRAGDHWDAFHAAFITREWGLVGVREYPHGEQGAADVDSGPLVAGVSLSASAVGLAAARRAGAPVVADGLDREAEMFGLAFSWAGERFYAGGVLPVGDAFVAWARTDSPAPAASVSDGPAPLLWPFALVPALGGLLCVWAAVRLGPPARPVATARVRRSP